jgi:formylglycine-generating enzyme required for sulfatase activity
MTDETVLTNSIGMKFKVIPSGAFVMGTTDGESHEGPPHVVTLTSPFELGIHLVTQEQYLKFFGVYKDVECPHCNEVFSLQVDGDKIGCPSKTEGPNNPVDCVTWADAVEFCQRLSAHPDEKAAGHAYRLPTEAEWEYACRAGTTTLFYWGEDKTQFEDYEWRLENSDEMTHPVGQKKPNPWGIFDMLGNAAEWCADEVSMYGSEPQTDPQAPESGDDNQSRVQRGGSCYSNTEGRYIDGHSAKRRSGEPTGTTGPGLGFRVVRTASE